MDKKIDFLAIGDIVAEPFIKITDAEENCDLQGDHCKICFRFGEKIPYESAEICYAVGNSPNVAMGINKLGINSALVSYVGDDFVGKQNIESLMKNGVNVDHLKIVPGMDSNYHYALWYDTERTILVKHTEFPYSFPKEVEEANWVYLSSLASNSITYHKEIEEYLTKYPDAKLIFQPGTFQIKLGIENLKSIYKRTEILFCNLIEAKKILETEESNIEKLLNKLKSIGPRIVIVTDGLKGAYCFDGENILFIPVYSTAVCESTGAGDAFASGIIAALIKGEDLEHALLWGPINSMSVVSHVGPQKGLLNEEQIKEYLSNAPSEYKISKLK